MSKGIIQIENISFDKISLCGEYTLNDRYVIIDLGYNNSDPLMLNIRSLNIQSYNQTTNEIYLDLRKNPEIKHYFENFDNALISKIKSEGILKKIGIRGVSYKSLVNDFTNTDNETYDVLRLKLMFDGDYKTILYDHHKNIVDNKDANTYIVKGSTAKVILELVAIVVDKEAKTIFIYNVVRHLQTKRNKPTRIKDIEYSFVDSDDENTIALSEVQKSCSNVQTESYIDTDIRPIKKEKLPTVKEEQYNDKNSFDTESEKCSNKDVLDDNIHSDTDSDTESKSDTQNSVELSSDMSDSEKFVKKIDAKMPKSMQLQHKAPKSVKKTNKKK